MLRFVFFNSQTSCIITCLVINVKLSNIFKMKYHNDILSFIILMAPCL